MSTQQMAQLRRVIDSGTPLMLILAPSAVCVSGLGSALSAVGGAILTAVIPD